MTMMEILLVGALATAIADLWQQALKAVTGVPGANWAVVGRWVLGWREGRICDPSIAARAPLKGEAVTGWAFHYLVGIAYAGLYLALAGGVAGAAPSLLNGLAFGLFTLAAPFLFMKPALGAGFFGLRAPQPARGFLLSVANHAVFGMALYWGVLIA